MSETRTWKGGWGSKTAKIAIDEQKVLLAADCGPGGAPVGASMTHAEFLEGRYHPVVRRVFGDAMLAEMVSMVTGLLEQERPQV